MMYTCLSSSGGCKWLPSWKGITLHPSHYTWFCFTLQHQTSNQSVSWHFLFFSRFWSFAINNLFTKTQHFLYEQAVGDSGEKKLQIHTYSFSVTMIPVSLIFYLNLAQTHNKLVNQRNSCSIRVWYGSPVWTLDSMVIFSWRLIFHVYWGLCPINSHGSNDSSYF